MAVTAMALEYRGVSIPWIVRSLPERCQRARCAVAFSTTKVQCLSFRKSKQP